MNLKSKLPFFIQQAKKSEEKEPIWLEYLESDSSAFIDTGVSGGNDNLAFSITFNAEKYTQYGAVFGNYIGNSIKCTRLLITTQDGSWMGAFKIAPVAGQVVINATLGDKHIVYVDKTGFTVDGNKFNAKAQTGDETTAPIALFNRSVSLPITRDIGLKIYSCQMYDNGVLIRDFRPCLHPTTRRPAMYDMVEKKYYYNQGTGEFKYEETFIKLEYLESNGTQYIDTGVVIRTNNYRKEITLSNVGAGVGSNSPYAVMGTQFGANRNPYLALNTAGKLAVGYAGQSGAASTLVFDNPTSGKTFILERKPDGFTFTNGDTTYTPSYTGGQDTNNLSEWIFALNIPNAGTYSASVRVYGYRLYVDDVLTRDYIPVRTNDGRFGLYDFVTGQFYGNAGTGAFKGYIGDIQLGEYLQSTHAQYIDTEYHANQDTKISMVFQEDNAVGSGFAFWGARSALSGSQDSCVFWGAASNYWRDQYDGQDFTSTLIKETNKHSLVKDKNVTYFDGNLFRTHNYTPFTGRYTVFLYAIHEAGAPMYHAQAKIYSYKCWDNGTPICDMIPAKLADGRIGMWDFVRGKLFENQGTGEFVFE